MLETLDNNKVNNQRKHAFLIIAHDSFEQLQRLLATLDDERNDIFVHIDKKSVMPDGLMCSRAGLYFCDRRIDVRWGDISQILNFYQYSSSALLQLD